jgi:hypothetical protein
MPTRSGVLLACCLLGIPFAGVHTQTDPSGGVTLRPGQTLRVWLADGRRFEARLVAVDGDPRVLRFAEPHPVAPLAAIDSLWLRRHSPGRGALIGGIVVGAASFAVFTAWCYALGEGDGCHDWGYVVGFAVVGGGIGALLGSGVGGLVPRWRRLDPQRVAIGFGAGDHGLTAGARIRF